MAEAFQYDVFLSHSAKDKAMGRFSHSLSASTGERVRVRCRSFHLAARLRQNGLKVWFDEWEIKPGDQTSKPGSSRRESAQTSERADESMSGLTSAATRGEKIEEGLEPSNFGCRTSNFGFAQPGMSSNAFGLDWAQPQQPSTFNHQPHPAPR